MDLRAIDDAKKCLQRVLAVDPAWPFAASGTLFLATAVLILALPGTFRAIGPDGAVPARRRMRAESAEGRRWLRSDALVRPMVMTAGVGGLMNSAITGVLVLFVLEELELDQRGFGFFTISAAVGGVIGSVTAAGVSARLGQRTALVLAQPAVGLGYLGLGLAPHWTVGAVFFASPRGGSCSGTWSA